MEQGLGTIALEAPEVSLELEEPPMRVEDAAAEAPSTEAPAIVAELVIEEISIDGMCGVY